ncbi:hypothetical protein Trydic_g12775 [Trypoxylus dichotomus]
MFSSNAISRRLNVLVRILQHVNGVQPNLVRAYVSNESVSIGGITKIIKQENNPEYVPRNYYTKNLGQSALHHLRWIMQKDLLGQDVFLIGPPGPRRRKLALQYLELTNREHEYIALSRDTTESDIKQRREIVGGTAKYFDQSAVRAAITGRVLVLEGIEKAERNVLPVLNNLLENREMHLEDGRLLIPAQRYDKLLQEYSKEQLDQWQLVRVNEDFRVIALGLPVPKYRGNPLDPPLRSRFQARDIGTNTFQKVMCFGNMNGNRWESSSRSLFVKTIWEGDHHHVVLDKGDPLGEIANFPKTARSRKSSGSNRSTASAPISKMNKEDSQTSQFQFLITGGGELKKTPSLSKQTHSNNNESKTITISVIPKTHVKFRSLTEELVVKHKKLPTRKSKSLEIADSTADNSIITPYFTYSASVEKNNLNTLSERVLNWMNLTNTEVLDFKENLLNSDVKKRAVTAHTCSNLLPKPEVYIADRRCKPNSAPKSFSKISEEDVNEVMSVEEVFEECKFNSHPEEVPLKTIKQLETTAKNRFDFCKRQLHIFMPNIPKKGVGDSESTLSGRSSSFLRISK